MILLAIIGIFLIVDDVLQHTIGSPLSGKSKFNPKQIHHSYIGLLFLILSIFFGLKVIY
jgi:hypothetical protein